MISSLDEMLECVRFKIDISALASNKQTLELSYRLLYFGKPYRQIYPNATARL